MCGGDGVNYTWASWFTCESARRAASDVDVVHMLSRECFLGIHNALVVERLRGLVARHVCVR